MTHVLVAGKLHSSGIELLKSASGVTFDYVEEISEASYSPLIDKADALVIRTQPLSASTVAKAGRLKVVSRHGVGYEAIDQAALNERGIALTIVGDVNSISVAEHGLMMLMAAAKRTVSAHKSVTGGNWNWRNQLAPVELHGKRLLIIGYGRIGRHFAKMASAIGMQVCACDPYLESKGWPKDAVATPCDLTTGLGWADMVSINVPMGERPVLGSDELALMKRGSILVNTARGGVVDEAALVASLKANHIAAAGIDVFEKEPPSNSNELLAFDQVVLSPHVAGLTAEAGERTAVSSVQNVLDFFRGTLDPALIVNRSSIKAMFDAAH